MCMFYGPWCIAYNALWLTTSYDYQQIYILIDPLKVIMDSK